MAKTIIISGHDFAALAQYGLADCLNANSQLFLLEFAKFCNERPSGYGDSEGEWFETVDRHTSPDGTVYSVLITGTHGNDHSPGASHYTQFELYPHWHPDYLAAVQEWMDKPEDHPDADGDDETDADVTYEVVVSNIGTVYAGPDISKAIRTFDEYVGDSKNVIGCRAYGENVALFVNYTSGVEIEREHHGHLQQDV